MNLSSEWAYIEKIAAIRRKKHKNNKYHISFLGPLIDIAGAAGELAARRYFGLPEELHTDLDGGVDFVWRGWKIDVKTTKLHRGTPNNYLQWPVTKPMGAEIVWIVGLNRKAKEAVMMGWQMADVILAAPVNPDRKIPCHEIPYRQMRFPYEIWVS